MFSHIKHSHDSDDEIGRKRSWLTQKINSSKHKTQKHTKKKAKKLKLHRKHKSTKKSSSESSDSSSDSDSQSSPESSPLQRYDSDDSYSSDNKHTKEKRKKNWTLAKQREREHERMKRKFIEDFERQRDQELATEAIIQYIRHKIDTFVKKRQFFNGPNESPEISEEDLKGITVTLIRNIDSDCNPDAGNGEINRDYNDLENATVCRKPDEGEKPLFDREEIKRFIAKQAATVKEIRILPSQIVKTKKIHIKKRLGHTPPRNKNCSPPQNSRTHPHHTRYHSKDLSDEDYPKRKKSSRERSYSRDSSEQSYNSEESDEEYYNKYDQPKKRFKLKTYWDEKPPTSDSGSRNQGSDDSEESDEEGYKGSKSYEHPSTKFRHLRGRPPRFMFRGRPHLFRGRGFPGRPMMRPGMNRPFIRGGRFPMGHFRPPFRPPRFMRPHTFRPYNNRYNNPAAHRTESPNNS